MPLLTVSNLNKQFGTQHVIKDVSFTLNKDSCIALIGPNGAGKTTILKMMTQLLNKTSGSVTFHKEKHYDIRSLIGYLPQYPVFYSWMTGEEFLIFAGQLTQLNKKEAKERAASLLERVSLTDARHKKISTYSGGMKQRLGIAQALIHRPKLLLLDEPVSALDPIGRRDILNLMEELKNETTILYSTHILTDAEEVSDTILLLHQGELIESGSINELRRKYRTDRIELSFDGGLEEYISLLNTLATTVNSQIVHDKIIVTVSDIEQARQDIMTLISHEQLPLIRFNVSQISLEDMFMKVVNR